MKYLNKLSVILLIPVLVSVILSGCGNNETPSKETGDDKTGTTDTQGTADTESTIEYIADMAEAFTKRDLEQGYTEKGATKITLNGNSASVDGSGATVSGSTVTISGKGVYILSGELTGGQIVVDAADTENIQIVLNNASVTCPDNAAIYVKQANKVFITTAEGTVNSLADGDKYTVMNGDDGVDSVIYSRSDLVLNGRGELDVTANYKHGIVSKDDLKATGGTYKIVSKGAGIVGKDSVRISGGSFIIDAEGDGVKSNNTEDLSRGYITVYGGTLDISSKDDGLQAETAVRIEGGTIRITAYDYIVNLTDEIEINGGSFLGVGIGVLATSDSSGQKSITKMFTSSADKGTEVTVADSDGNTLTSMTTRGYAFKAVFFSSPELVSGNTYTVTAGDISVNIKP